MTQLIPLLGFSLRDLNHFSRQIYITMLLIALSTITRLWEEASKDREITKEVVVVIQDGTVLNTRIINEAWFSWGEQVNMMLKWVNGIKLMLNWVYGRRNTSDLMHLQSAYRIQNKGTRELPVLNYDITWFLLTEVISKEKREGLKVA